MQDISFTVTLLPRGGEILRSSNHPLGTMANFLIGSICFSNVVSGVENQHSSVPQVPWFPRVQSQPEMNVSIQVCKVSLGPQRLLAHRLFSMVSAC